MTAPFTAIYRGRVVQDGDKHFQMGTQSPDLLVDHAVTVVMADTEICAVANHSIGQQMESRNEPSAQGAKKANESRAALVIHHEYIAVRIYTVALCPFGQMTEKLRPISVIPESLPSISTRYGVIHRTGKLNPYRS